ncbi:MAG: hypothetical protein JXA96_06665 [Sedimentisphaerales bacterium]|nr:hypothetical protein [Sedimentisphaerales bacterium]
MPTEVYTYLAKYLDQLREYAPIYRAAFLRNILESVRDDKPAPEKEPQSYVYQCIARIFKDSEVSLKRNIINYFLQVELPSLAADEKQEKEKCDAIDNLLECLNDKSAKEISDLINQLEGLD